VWHGGERRVMNVYNKSAAFDPEAWSAKGRADANGVSPGTGNGAAPVLRGPTGIPVTALVLAGTRGRTDPVASAEGVTHKALVRVGPVTMLELVLIALRDAGVQRVLVSTDAPAAIALAEAAGAEVVEPGLGPSESVSRGMDTADAPLLVTTADHPLLSPEWITDFVNGSPAAADVAVMLARQEDVDRAVPGSRRTWLRFADGAWSGCNLFFLATPNAQRALDQWRFVEAERKRPWRLAARLGWSTLFEYIVGRLTMAEAIIRLGARLGLSAALVPATHGMAAVDVDTVDDLALVRNILSGLSQEGLSPA
jgi:GTP:adenosylcobinamide-phosphate guanylyltransferase